MNVSAAIHDKKTPAWISAACAAVVGFIAVWAFAANPSEQTLDDHENRIRELEQISAERLTSIDQRLEVLQREVQRLRNQR